MTTVGIDIGTTGCKAVSVGSGGEMLATAQVKYDLRTPERGAAELDPTAVWDAVRTCVREVVSGSPVAPIAVGVSVAGEALVPIDANGVELHNFITSVDTRCATTYASVLAEVGDGRLRRPSGLAPLSHYSLFRWKWFAETFPDLFAKTRILAGHAEWLAIRLGVPPAVDRSIAARSLAYDTELDAWDTDLLATLGIERDLLPSVVPSGTRLGEIGAPHAEELGLRPSTPVAIAGLDQACAAVAARLTSDRTAMLSIGTVAVLLVELPQKGARPDSLADPTAAAVQVPIVPHLKRDSWIALASTPAAGAVVEWFSRNILRGSTGPAELVHGLADNRTPLLALPHLGGSRTAFADPGAVGAVLGLTFSSDRDDVVRALMDGVAYELAVLVERLDAMHLTLDSVIAVGGGSQSASWLQPISDVLGIPVRSTDTSFGAALGAAVIARDPSVLTKTSQWAGLPITTSYEPRSDWATYHAERLREFKSAYGAISTLPRPKRA